MQMTPIIAIHASAAIAALVLGPLALWARKGRTQRPRLHRAFGYAWITLMLATAISALFIRDFRLPNIAGYTPIHVLVPVTLFGLFGAFYFLAKGNVNGHRKVMTRLYYGACVVAGAFTLLPGRYLGNLVWGSWLGLIPPDYQPPAGSPPITQWLAATPAWTWLAIALPITLLVMRRLRTMRTAA